VLVVNALARKSSDLLEINQSQNAAMFSSKCETFVYRYITPNFVGHSFRVKGKTWYFFCRFTVVHFDLISNIFFCRYASRTLRMKLLTWCRVISRARLLGSGRAGRGHNFVKIFRVCIQNFFYNIRSRPNDFLFCDVHLLCSPRLLL